MTTLQLAAVFLCILHVSEAVFSSSNTSCCTQLGSKISKSLLKKVTDFKIQKRDGTCHLQAYVLYIKGRTLCMSRNSKRVKAWIEKQTKKNANKRQSQINGVGKRKRNRTKGKKRRNRKKV